MASGATSRLAIPYPVGSDPTNIPGDTQSLATRLDNIAVSFLTGTLASRPAAGTVFRMYYATDTGNLSLDTGAIWVDIGGAGGTVPIGGVVDWPGIRPTIPANFLLCDGTAYAQSTYPSLYAALGGASSVWGHTGSTFNVPDYRGVAGVGADNATGPRPGLRNWPLNGFFFGEENHTLTQGEGPVHGHVASQPTHYHGVGGDTGFRIMVTVPSGSQHVSTDGSQQAISATALDGAAPAITIALAPTSPTVGHNTIQPSIALNYIIRAI